MTMPATVKSQTQQKQTVQQAAALLQPAFDRHAHRILSDTANRLYDTNNQDGKPAYEVES